MLLLPLAAESEPEGIAQGSRVVRTRVVLQDIGICAGCGVQTGSLQMLTIKTIDLVFHNVCRSALEDSLNTDKVCRIHPFVGLHHRWPEPECSLQAVGCLE